MRTRHKMPTLVSMWMLDVFCCALGCVTLLWLINTRDVKMRSIELGNTTKLLSDAKADLVTLNSKAEQDTLRYEIRIRDLDAKLLAMIKERDENAKLLALARVEIESTGEQLALTQEVLDELSRLLAGIDAKNTDLNTRLTKKQLDLEAMLKDRDDAQKQIVTLQTLMREKEKTITDAARRSLTLEEKLSELDTKYKSVVKLSDSMVEKNATDALALRTRIKSLEDLLEQNQKQMKDANVMIVDLQGTKAKLADKINQLNLEKDTRFAGIAMTGRKVMFLIDISGSMDRLNYETPQPTKWPTVRETVGKVMRSLPDLESFQVIVFSDKMLFLLGSENGWIPYDKNTSIERVQKALSEITPKGDTNLYTPLDTAFKFREKGMDTVYLFSDGLPTQGPGLTVAQQNGMEVVTPNEKAEIMGRFVRTQLRNNWNSVVGTQAKVRINTIGFFYESPDLGAFLWALARENDGSFVGMSKP